MLSPGLTSTSMTATLLKLPMSGTFTSIRRAIRIPSESDFPGIGLRRVDLQIAHRFRDGSLVDLAFIGQRAQRGPGDVIAIDFEVLAQLRARIRAAVAVGAERDVAPLDPLANLIGHGAHVVRCGDARTVADLGQLPARTAVARPRRAEAGCSARSHLHRDAAR